MASAKPTLTRLETRAVEEDSRSKSTRHQWRTLYDDFCVWLRAGDRELECADLDNQLSEYLREKYFEGKPRSFAVNLVKAVKFEIPSELGRDGLWRARSACAAWDSLSGPWVESDPEKVRATVLSVFRTPALLHFLGASMGCFQVLKLRRLFKAMVSSVDHVIKSIFGSMAGDVAGGRFLLEDFQHFFTQQLFGEKEGKDEGTLSSTPRHPAVRFVNENSPGLLQLEMSGSASFQVNGHFALFGQELFEINVDTVGLLFQKGSVSGTIPTEHALQRHDGNNLDKSMEAGSDDSDVTFLGECFRKFLDPHDVTDIIQVLNPWTLSTLAKLFPDGKYDVALIQDTFESFSNTAVYALEETNWLHRIRGSPEECYLSCPPGADYRPDKVNHLLKTQQHLDDRRVKFYMKELQEALEAGSCRRPSALVFDFFDEGEIHAVQPDEENADDLRGPGGRRKQRRRPEACDAEYLKKWKKAWILLDGHHKVEAAARLGCSLNFLIISPCAEPYSELELDPQISSPLLRQMSCPWLWPHSTVPQSTPLCARWPEGDLCPHSPMLLSTSRQPPEVWQDVLGCDCFSKDPSFPTWGFQLLKDSFLKRLGRKKLTELLQERFGVEHPLFTTHLRSRMGQLPQDLQMELFSIDL